jgi:putative two-component system response regulator
MQELGADRPINVAPIKVLIVDDDATFSRSIGRILTKAGYDCGVAASGADARERLNNEDDIAAVLCDLRMPGESGLDLVATLAADFSEMAVVMTTGVDDPPTAALAFEMGAYGYLIKPFTANEILITLVGALRRRELETVKQSQIDGLEQTVARLKTLHSVVDEIGTASPGSSSSDEPEIIERLSRAVSPRPAESAGHIQRMSRYALMLAEVVGSRELSPDEFRLANALHDVGKIGVPDGILLKPGPLSPGENVAMQRHAQIGYQLLSGTTSKLLEMAARIALGHHEWWNGGGYPRGLHGGETPLEARIAGVADAFDALTSNRAHPPGVSVDDAIEMMIELRGRQFEPRLLDAFVGSRDEIAVIRSASPDRHDAPRVRVLVVDDQEPFVQGLVGLLRAQPTINLVGCAATAREAEKAAVAHEPDVVLIDFDLPDSGWVKATETIKALVPKAKVVMLTGSTDQQALVRAIGAGCAGFVTKTDPIEMLVGAIHSAHEGESPTANTHLPRLLAQLRPTNRGLGSDLGPRELEVLRLMATGAPNKALARQLHLSLNTVRNHVQHVLYKLGAHSKLEAVATAVREGVIERDSPALGQGRM